MYKKTDGGWIPKRPAMGTGSMDVFSFLFEVPPCAVEMTVTNSGGGTGNKEQQQQHRNKVGSIASVRRWEPSSSRSRVNRPEYTSKVQNIESMASIEKKEMQYKWYNGSEGECG